jgi:hypothetical protein
LTAEHLLRRFKMAASGATPIILYHSTTGSAVPSNANLAPGELAVNIADMKLYCENDSGVVTLLASAAGSAGDVVGPGSATDGAIVAFDGTTGKLIKAAVLGTGVQTALGVNTGSAGAVVLFDGALGTPSSGTLSSCTVDGTDAVGFRNTPVNSQSADYTLVLADSGKTILHPVADDNARTFTIPANSSVAYPVGTVISFVNLQNTVTIAITTDTMYLANDGDTGDRTLAEYGMASAMKVASTTWIISGSGLT